MARRDPDKELEQYRKLMEPPDEFEDGFSWKTVIGALGGDAGRQEDHPSEVNDDARL